jgi:hypothetical protein
MTHGTFLLHRPAASLIYGRDEPPATQAPRKDDMPTRSPEDYEPPAERPRAEEPPAKPDHLRRSFTHRHPGLTGEQT